MRMRKTTEKKQFRQAVLICAAVCTFISLWGCTFDSDSDSDALYTFAELEAALKDADGGVSPDAPVSISFAGKEKAFAVYAALANARKYVSLNLSKSSVTGFDTSSAYPAGSRWIVSLILPDNLTKIGGEAFAGWTQLRHIFIPPSVTAIGEYAFYNCSSLADIQIPESVTTIGEYAFHRCPSIAELTIPESVEYIERDAFSSCGNLNIVTFLGDGTRIADNTVFPGGTKFREAAARLELSGSGSYTAARGVYLRNGAEWSRE